MEVDPNSEQEVCPKCSIELNYYGICPHCGYKRKRPMSKVESVSLIVLLLVGLPLLMCGGCLSVCGLLMAPPGESILSNNGLSPILLSAALVIGVVFLVLYLVARVVAGRKKDL